MPRLSAANLAAVADEVAVPSYDRSAITPGIVHFGVGGFHRAHHAMVIDELLRAGSGGEWGIVGVGVRPEDSRIRAALNDQDGLYTLVEKHADGTRAARVIGSFLRMLTVDDDGSEAILALMSSPSIRIVSLTVTEGGYNIDQATGEFILDAPAIAADLTGEHLPRTVFGVITEALRLRREAGIAPFTVMSCDNLQNNGEIAKRTVTTFARAKDAELGEWIAQNTHFPNSMVDRITPVTTDDDRAEAERLTGVQDAWPVVCEPFFQWVLEDDFGDGRPPYDDARVQLVHDVEPYELMKLRVLNMSHQALCYFAHLLGYRYVDQAMADPLISGLLRRYITDEAVPTLRPVPGIDLDEYRELVISRFGNPHVRDTVARLCVDSSDRIPKWLVPIVDELLRDGRDVTTSAAIVASWARYATGVDEQGQPIDVVDQRREQVMAAAQNTDDALAFIRDETLFADLASRDEFTGPYLDALAVLRSQGAKALLEQLLTT